MLKRQILLSQSVVGADHVVRATLRNSAGTTVKGVVCGIFLPKRQTDPIKLQFQPTAKQANHLYFTLLRAGLPELAFSATTRHGGRRIRFSAERVWCTSISTGHQYEIPYVTDFTGTPSDFHIEHSGVKELERGRGTLFLTPNELVNTAMIIRPSYTGNVRARRVVQPRFSLQSGVRLTFAKHFSYKEGERDETISFPELAAEFRFTRKPSDMFAVSRDLDGFLLLTSFATRHRCVCLGWTYTNSRGVIVTHYRRNIAIPRERDSRNRTLIDMSEFPKFIRATYRRYCKFAQKEQFNSALYPLIGDADKTTEMSYFSLFSALESALLFADRTFHLFPPGHQRLQERWRLFRAQYPVDLSDLWPLTDSTNGITLAQLRNKVAHGEYLNQAQTHALVYAKEHLRWTVERVLLSLLQWPISRSNAGSQPLSYIHPYRSWAQARAVF
jgi:hypothetical protein